MEDTMATTGSLSPSSTISDLGLDLSGIPPVAVLSAHFKDGEEGKVKEMLRRFHAPYTADVARAKVFIGKVATKKRAEFELRARKIVVDEVVPRKRLASPVQNDDHASKKPRMSNASIALDGADEDASATEDETVGDSSLNAAVSDGEVDNTGLDPPSADVLSLFESSGHQDYVWVIRLDWLEDCVQAGHLLPLKDRLVYTGRVRSRPKSVNPKPGLPLPSNKLPAPAASQTLATAAHPRDHGGDILQRAEADAVANPPKPQYQPQRTGPSHGSRRFEGKTYAPTQQPSKPSLPPATANLLQQTTSEYEGEDSDTPPPPDWVVRRVKYACQRYTPANSPNSAFLSLLQQIRTARTLIDDTIGVRAYSTIIASIAAYPYPLSHPREIASLPGCDEKTAVLFAEWKNTGRIQAVEDFLADPAMQILRSFYDIWGVGAKTARQFYYTNGWRELDDIIEYGWAELDRVQQIGVKYYDDFLSPIPRSEVEAIASVVRAHAAALRDERVTATLVGGYRRGKEASGDVDVVVSHPELSATHNLVAELVASLEKERWITHTLTLSLTNSHRGQHALPFRTSRAAGGGPGFDTLDKALVVWQDPVWPTRESDIAQNARAKNPNIHRRVDIIVAPWRTLGCAVMGWSGGTTFQRDLRRYAKAVKGWKFDSSGIRDRGTGEEVLLEGEADEGDEGDTATPEEKEMKVFAGLGLDYIPPHGRCTF